MAEGAGSGARGARRARRSIARSSSTDVDISEPGRGGRRRGERRASTRGGARAAIDDPAIKDALKREVERRSRAACSARRSSFVDGEPFWGLDRFDQIERWLATGGF